MTSPPAANRTTVLVTGGSGFLGGHVIPLLVKRGYDVVALARNATAAERVAELGAEPIIGDLDDPASIDEAFLNSGAQRLVNLASLGFGQAPTIVAAAAEAGITRGVFVSSTAIFTTLNAPSKPRRRAGEDAVTSSPLEWTVVRPTMIYGTPGDRNLARLLQVLRRVPVLALPGGGDRLQQPVHVDDLAAAIVTAMERPESIHRTYELAGPEPISFRSLIEQAGAAVGRRPRLIPVPLRPTIAFVRAYERVTRRPRIKAEQLERLSEDKAFDITAARQDLDFDPRPFSVGIAQEAALLGLAAETAPDVEVGTALALTDASGSRADSETDAHFAEVADSWIRRYADRPSFRHRLDVVGAIVADVVGTHDHANVLDFGGGPGVFSAVASVSAARVTCLDVSEPMIRAGADRADMTSDLVLRAGFGVAHPERVRRVVGPLDCLQPEQGDPDSTLFDVVLTIAVLEYLDDPAKIVFELGRRLRKGGHLVLTVPDNGSWYRRAEDLAGSLGASAGRVTKNERLRSRAYASTRPHGNRVPWNTRLTDTGLFLDRSAPLMLSSHGWMSRVAATRIVVLRRQW